jgi:hypothetical protein
MFDKTEPVVWLYYADNSYVATRLLWFTRLALDSAVYSHRTVELYLKAFLVSQGAEVKPGLPAWGHDLARLGEAAAGYDPGFAKGDVARRLLFFERYFYQNMPENPQACLGDEWHPIRAGVFRGRRVP